MISSQQKDRVKVSILTSVHIPFDGRIFHKEAKTLARAGYEVVLIAPVSKEEVVDGVRMLPLPKPKNRFERMTKVVWRLFRLAFKEKADVYHFHDPELMPVGILLKLLGKKVIYDVHEDYSEQILNKDWVGNTYIRKLAAFATKTAEQVGAFFFDGIVTATPHIAEKFPPRKTTTVRNLPILELIDRANPLRDALIYAGALTAVRGIEQLIQAMALLQNRAELWLLGKWESKEFESKCAVLEGWRYTDYLGHVPYPKVSSYVKRANVGLINFLPVPNQQRAMPNKPFEYMACSLAMIMSNFAYWREIFGECALFVNPYDPEDIANKVLYLLDNPDKAKELSDKGRALIEEEYSWEAEQVKLLDIYKKVLIK
jgi:glycosyltransferase involved in cell wall biosynthesis